ncbi:hypothetical protein [Oryzobacter terrae]|uniref:hypothetical protein n=1 Tax=Oryzobacter terrae TaxID=1620385 RepID=UPI003671CF44
MGEQPPSGPVLATAPRSRGALVAAFVGVALVVVGALMLALRGPTAEFGWFAYSSTPDASPVFWVLDLRQVLGSAVLAGGLAVAAAALGYRSGLRRRP